MTKSQFLRSIRKLQFKRDSARTRLDTVRALADTLTGPSDLSVLEAEHAAALAAFDAHAALNPGLAAEYADRVEPADTLATVRRIARQLDTLRHRPPADPGELPVDTETPALIHEASALDAEHRAAVAEPAPNWAAIGTMEARAAKLREAIERAERRHAVRIERHRTAASAARRHAADVMLLSADLDRARAYAHELRQRLPETPEAPLREPRRAYRSAVPAHLHTVIRERYHYNPATDTLHRTGSNQTVTAPQSIMVNGTRVPRAQLIAVLFNPETLA